MESCNYLCCWTESITVDFRSGNLPQSRINWDLAQIHARDRNIFRPSQDQMAQQIH